MAIAATVTTRKALFSFSEVEAKKASPTTINQIIKDVMRASNDACYSEMERWLLPPGVSGSRSFDQAYAVEVVLKHDAQNGGRIAVIMESQGLSRRLLWDRIQSVLRSVGFKFSHGRLVGVLEDMRDRKDSENDDMGQPDVE